MIQPETIFTVVPAFLTKLWSLVEDPLTNDLIFWDESGMSFHVSDQTRFAREILPLYFKHNNIASFIRQLNMYGFHKVINTEVGNLRNEKEDLEFAHQYFIRDKEELLENIKRKTASQGQVLSSMSKKDVSKIMGEVSALKIQIDSMTDTLENLKIENEILWKEIVNLRQKHARQHQVVSKLFQFFMSFMNERNQSSIRRKLPLMIKDSETNLSTSELKDENLKLEPLVVIDVNDEKHPEELSDFQIFQQNQSNLKNCLDVESGNYELQLTKELPPKPDQILYFKDMKKDEITKNIDSFQSSLDTLYDIFSSGQYSLDPNLIFEPKVQNELQLIESKEEDPEDVPSKKQKLNEGKELIQYTSPEEMFFNISDFNNGFPENTEKQNTEEVLSPSILDDFIFTPQWSPKNDT